MTAKRRRTAGAGVSVSVTDESEQEVKPELALELIAACLDDDLSRVEALVVSERADAWIQEAHGGWTSLHAAAYVGNLDMVKLLLRKGNAVWNLVDDLGMTAADVAFSMNHADIYEFLVGEGVRAEMLSAVLSKDDEHEKTGSTLDDNDAFLKSKLRFETDESGQEICVDAEGQGVMMGWETEVMRRTASLLTADCEACRAENGEFNVLNVGFGLGIIDEALSQSKPTNHLIIEPHPDVLAHARAKGWYDRARFYEGTWQQYFDDLINEKEAWIAWDAVYFDTYSEHYRDLHAFFDRLPDLLRGPLSRFSFFHGLGATNRTFYDVYTTVSELHLREIGLGTEWDQVDVDVANATRTWQGTEKRYWGDVGPYRLPLCRLLAF